MFFEKSNGQCIVNHQGFMWVAEYQDGSIYTEFDMITKAENNFYQINKKTLDKYGLIGNGYKFYYDVNTGYFMIDGRRIDIQYETNEKTYNFIGQPQRYDSIIQFKDAESNFNPLAGQGDLNGTVVQHNFGYKTKFVFDDVEINIRAICSIPYDKPVCMEFRLVANHDLNGKFIIRRDGMIIDSYEAPLKANIGGLLNWDVK